MNIRVDLNTSIKDGTEVVFRSPVDCSQVTGLKVYHIGADGNTASQEFVLADAHGNNVGCIAHLFAEDVVVKVILDVTTSMAFVQNADTNAYLEGRFGDIETALDSILAIQNELMGGGGEDVTLITFKVDGNEHTAEDGKTFAQFIESDYNPTIACSECGASTKIFWTNGGINTFGYSHDKCCVYHTNPSADLLTGDYDDEGYPIPCTTADAIIAGHNYELG